MRIHRGVLHDDVLWSLDANGGEVPQGTDASAHQAVGHQLCLQDGNSEDGNFNPFALDACGQLIDMIDGRACYFGADDVLSDIEACRYFKPELS